MAISLYALKSQYSWMEYPYRASSRSTGPVNGGIEEKTSSTIFHGQIIGYDGLLEQGPRESSTGPMPDRIRPGSGGLSSWGRK